MLPFEPDRPVVLPGTPVWLAAGRTDPTVPHQNIERLAQLLRDSGARVTLEWRDAGHQMTAEDVDSAGPLAFGPPRLTFPSLSIRTG